MNQIATKRNYAFDVLRFAAISAVIMIHVSSRLFYEFDSATFLVGNIFNSVSRFAVPVFAMITGALLLREEKEISVKEVFSKYILRTALLFVFWSGVYVVIFRVLVPLKNGIQPDVSEMLKSFIKGHYHMWYLYMLAGFYLVLPLMKKFVRKDNMKAVSCVTAAMIIIQSLLPLADIFIVKHTEFSVVSFYENSGLRTFFGFHMFFLLGRILSSIEIKKIYKCLIYVSGGVSIVLTVVFTQIISEKKAEAFTRLYDNLYLNTVITSVAVFVFIFSLFKNKNDTVALIKSVSGLSFGIYIVHPIVIELFCSRPFMPQSPVLYIISLWLITAVVSYAVCLAVSKIPFIKKLIRT